MISDKRKTRKHGPSAERNMRPGYAGQWKGRGTECLCIGLYQQDQPSRIRGHRYQHERLEEERCTLGGRGSDLLKQTKC